MRTLAVIASIIAVGMWLYILKYGTPDNRTYIDAAVSLTHGNPAEGSKIIQKVGCTGCHEIPGIAAAHGTVGPSLKGFRDRSMIAGVMSNSADHLILWLQDPPSIDPKTAMPNLGLTEQQARDVAAFLLAPNNYN